jgi:hypothetical protein
MIASFFTNLNKSGNKSSQIFYNTYISDLKNSGSRIFVDGHNILGIAHAHYMLHRPGYAACNVKLRRNGCTGDPHLTPVFQPAQIANDAGTGNRRLREQSGQLIYEIQVFFISEALADRDNDTGFGDARHVRLSLFYTR